MLAQSARSSRYLTASATLTAMPQVSVVLLVSPATPAPAVRLASAVSTCKEHGAELLVAFAGPRAALRSLESAFPSVRFVTAEGDDVDLRALRVQACQVATGDLVSVVHETQALDETWFARHLGASEAKAAWREGGSA